jgi:hypothetical protein
LGTTFGKELKMVKREMHVLQNNVKVLTFLEKRISEISLRYRARSLNNFCVLKVLYECVTIH